MSRPFRSIVCALLTLVLCGWSASQASAAVAVRGTSSCNSNAVYPAVASTLSLSLSPPAGLQAGDVMIATWSGYQSLSGAPSGWTATFSPGSSSGTWYRVATASEPSTYTWTATKDIFHNVSISGVITAFSGVDTASPIADSAQATGSAASAPLPAATATAAGSMRVSTLTSAAATTSTFTGMTLGCDRSAGSTSAALAYESVNAGAVPTRTASRSGTGSYTAQTLVLDPLPVPCNTGSFSLTPAATIGFGSTTLDGTNRQQTSSTTFRVDDQRGTGPGWNVAITSTSFTSGGNTLPAGAVKVQAATMTPVTGNCAMPTNAVAYPAVLPAGLPAPTAAKLFNAVAGTGKGPVDVHLGLLLDIPGNARAGAYTSTWTFSLQSGP